MKYQFLKSIYKKIENNYDYLIIKKNAHMILNIVSLKSFFKKAERQTINKKHARSHITHSIFLIRNEYILLLFNKIKNSNS